MTAFRVVSFLKANVTALCAKFHGALPRFLHSLWRLWTTEHFTRLRKCRFPEWTRQGATAWDRPFRGPPDRFRRAGRALNDESATKKTRFPLSVFGNASRPRVQRRLWRTEIDLLGRRRAKLVPYENGMTITQMHILPPELPLGFHIPLRRADGIFWADKCQCSQLLVGRHRASIAKPGHAMSDMAGPIIKLLERDIQDPKRHCRPDPRIWPRGLLNR
jgi:hypothetical protein